MNDTDLDVRLHEWAVAFGGEQFQRSGIAATERINAMPVDAVSAVPAPAAQIEYIVQCMEHAGRWREGRVLRVQYFCAGATESERLHRLARIGITMARSAYYAYLASARSFVLGSLVYAGAAEAA